MNEYPVIALYLAVVWSLRIGLLVLLGALLVAAVAPPPEC